ncbi:MAG TPA: NADP-dependent isocitrate dehydrogenase [Anaerolineaceae bacterium]
MGKFQEGQKIIVEHGDLSVPAYPLIPFVEGDGSGPEIWQAARSVLDAAVETAYGDARQIAWLEVYAGKKAATLSGTPLPDATLQAFRECLVGIKGPLETPVGTGIRSLNVALRKALDLFVCLRPVRWYPGVPCPVLHPENVNMVIFRENTEDLYTGIEYEAGSSDNDRLMAILKEHFPKDYARLRFPQSAALGIKPISIEGSQRLVRAAIRWALANHRKSVTLVHKGNVMKFTEGGFRTWGYALAEDEFSEQVYTWLEWERTRVSLGEDAANQQLTAAAASGKLIVKDVITDAMFEAALTRPHEYDVLATTNLNGDYLSDALAAQVGGLGIAPGANINFDTHHAIFEATHGTAPRLAGKNQANPCSLILSGEMLLRYLGWNEAADLVVRSIESVFAAHQFTADLAAQIEGVTPLSTTNFAMALISALKN